jgi:hypothetical protein
MHLKNYSLYDHCVVLVMTDRTVHTLNLHPLSGTVYYRFKIGTLSDVKHPGIYLGFDQAGNNYYMHNHYATGKPAIVAEQEFTQGQPLYLYEGTASNTPKDIVKIGLDQVLAGKPYAWLNYNCQSFVNRARINQNLSEDVEKWTKGVLLTLLVVLGVRAFNN